MYQMSTTKEIHYFPKSNDIIKEIIHTHANNKTSFKPQSPKQILHVQHTNTTSPNNQIHVQNKRVHKHKDMKS